MCIRDSSDDWWAWRRCELSWELIEEAQSKRAAMGRVAQFGYRTSHGAFVGLCKFMIQIPPMISCDRFACKSVLEA